MLARRSPSVTQGSLGGGAGVHGCIGVAALLGRALVVVLLARGWVDASKWMRSAWAQVHGVLQRA